MTDNVITCLLDFSIGYFQCPCCELGTASMHRGLGLSVSDGARGRRLFYSGRGIVEREHRTKHTTNPLNLRH